MCQIKGHICCVRQSLLLGGDEQMGIPRFQIKLTKGASRAIGVAHWVDVPGALRWSAPCTQHSQQPIL